MRVECAVPWCKNVPKRHLSKTLTFFLFPDNPKVASEWCKFIDVPGFQNDSDTVMCSAHFDDDCWLDKPTKTMMLPDCVPTIKGAVSEQQSPMAAGPSGSGAADKNLKRAHQTLDLKARATMSRKPRSSSRALSDDPDEADKTLGCMRGDTPFTEDVAYKHGLLVLRKLQKLPLSKGLLLQTAYNRSIRKRIGFGMRETIDKLFKDKLHS